MFLTPLKQICNEYLIKFSENQSTPKLENRKTSPCSPCAPNLLHVLISRIPGYHNLCSPGLQWILYSSLTNEYFFIINPIMRGLLVSNIILCALIMSRDTTDVISFQLTSTFTTKLYTATLVSDNCLCALITSFSTVAIIFSSNTNWIN